MMNPMRTRVVVLAAGKGTRMKSDAPKILKHLKGKAMIEHLLAAIKESDIDSRPVIVVGQSAHLVRQTLGDAYDYVEQKEQLGTGHAVQCAEKLLKGSADNVLVLYGDHPFLHASTITKLHNLHKKEGCVLSMMTTTVKDFDEWRAPFYDFGRVIRDASGKIISIVEVKDATPEERLIQEVNPSFFCFNAEWLWTNLKKLGNNNFKREYYLTDLVGIAIDGDECIASMDISPRESIGVNTPEHLELAQSV